MAAAENEEAAGVQEEVAGLSASKELVATVHWLVESLSEGCCLLSMALSPAADLLIGYRTEVLY